MTSPLLVSLVREEERPASRHGSALMVSGCLATSEIGLFGRAAVVTDPGTGFERIFERRIPVAAPVAACNKQAERQDGKEDPCGPHRRTPE